MLYPKMPINSMKNKTWGKMCLMKLGSPHHMGTRIHAE